MAKRRRKAEFREDLQPAPDPDEVDALASQYGFPSTVYAPSGGLLHFHGTAIITGDGLYRGYNNKGELKHCLVTNPDAASRQTAYLARVGGS